MSERSPLSRLPLRLRLTLWYLATFTLILSVTVLLLYWQLQRSLLAQIDATLHFVLTQAQVSVTRSSGQLTFQGDNRPAAVANRLGDDAAVFLLDPQGRLHDRLGDDAELYPFALEPGLHTYAREDDTWRVLTELLALPGQPNAGSIQVVQSLEEPFATLATLRLQLLWALPLVLALAAIGGYFLASAALSPITAITRTAQAITASDLTRRIGYTGPPDEVGRLAMTFDAMLERLQAAFGRERRFTADAAHELRTPLTALKGRTEVTLSHPRRPDEYVATLQDMERQVDRLIRLTSDLLFLARLDQHSRRLANTQIVVADLLDAVVEPIQPLAGSKSLHIAAVIPADLTVRGDLDLLIRLFLNLLDNAIKFTPTGGRITVTAERAGVDVRVTLADSGPGIAPEHLPHLFERFYRVEGARTRTDEGNRFDGAGLGLAIAHEIAVAHGGSLSAHSVPGEGTTFTVRLPQGRQPTG